MASIINASTSGVGGVITTADNSGDLNIQSGGSTKIAVTSAGAAVTGTLTVNGTAVATSGGAGSFTTLNASGVATFSAGSAAAPAITTTGDTNTGIFFPAADTVAWATSGTEKMRLTSGGVLLLNETSVAQAPLMQMTGNLGSYNNLVSKDTGTSYSTGARYVMFLNSTDGIAGVISHSGVTTVTYGTSSDQRLKQNIVEAPNALDKIVNIKVRSYDWKEDNSHVEYGFVAQELNEIYGEPVGVGGDDVKDEPWNIEYGRLTPILLKAIQEQQALIESLTTRLTALENK